MFSSCNVALLRTIARTKVTGPHRDNLRDVGRRYCDITSCDEVIEYLEEWRTRNR